MSASTWSRPTVSGRVQRLAPAVCAGLVAGALVGCEPIGEPWVAGADQLAEERARVPENADALRERLRLTQGDR